MIAANLSVVASVVPAPPYPADVLARGWGFTLEVERLTNSDTWSLTPTDLRPWLLMLWMQAWVQTPCGSLPSDDQLIASRIGMDPDLFMAKRDRLMRGWYRCSDGRLYHRVVTELVEKMRDSRAKDRARKAKQRADEAEASRGVPRDSGGSHATGTGTVSGTGTGESILTDGSGPTPAPALTYRPPNCPHQKILALWAEVLPELHQHDTDEWKGARADGLAARWKESAAKEGPKKHRWANEQDGLIYFRRLFQWMRASQFLMGRVNAKGDSRPFKLKLEWLVKPANWAKVIEGQYHEETPHG